MSELWYAAMLRQFSCRSDMLLFNAQFIGESKEGRMADALAHGGDEGRDKLR